MWSAEGVWLRRGPGSPYRDTADPRCRIRRTTELLLRSRDLDETLPNISPTLGHGFSGNGDYLALSNLRRGEGDLITGPTITTTTVLEVGEGSDPVWFQVQDGAVPLVVSEMLDHLLPRQGLRSW